MAMRGMLQVLQKYNTPNQSYEVLHGPEEENQPRAKYYHVQGAGF